jgi:pimeloyl-ACP methyl ester carboxylesterase
VDRVLSHRALSLLVCGALLAACSSAADGAATSTTTAKRTTTAEAPTTRVPPTTTTTISLPEPVPIAWRSCGGGFDCATVTVPIDYLAPASGTLDLALVRRPASDPAQRIGTLIMNPGGPGASGVRRVRRGFKVSPEVAARFDIVGFDPRGIGDSTPVQCGSTVAAFRAADLDPDTPEETAQLAAVAEAVASECATTEGPRLAHLGTWEVAHDVEVIRRAIGEPQVSYVGLSYGTLIGLLWAEAYPTSVRALVLDAVVDPASGAGAMSLDQIEAIDRTFAEIDAACATDTSCPLAGSGGVIASYDELARRVEAGEARGSDVGPTQLAYAAFSATYGSERWPELWSALRRGLDGDLGGVATMARWFTGLVSYAPFAIVTCVDSSHPVGFDAWKRSAQRAEEQSPRFGRIAANELLPCASWPVPSYAPHRVVAHGAPPSLVVGSTGDAATPYEQAVRVADDLESGVLLTVELAGHIALGDSDCADAAITRYLVDLAVPAAGTRC